MLALQKNTELVELEFVSSRLKQIIGNPAGKCYAASEAAYHLLGGRSAGYVPCVGRYDGGTHWWLRHFDGSILDLTAEQFSFAFPYEQGRGCGFLTSRPSKRAQEIIDAFEKDHRVS